MISAKIPHKPDASWDVLTLERAAGHVIHIALNRRCKLQRHVLVGPQPTCLEGPWPIRQLCHSVSSLRPGVRSLSPRITSSEVGAGKRWHRSFATVSFWGGPGLEPATLASRENFPNGRSLDIRRSAFCIQSCEARCAGDPSLFRTWGKMGVLSQLMRGWRAGI
jgi:hypothetical protein